MNAYFPCNICDLQVNKAPVIVDIYRYIYPVLPKNSWHTGIAKKKIVETSFTWKFHMNFILNSHTVIPVSQTPFTSTQQTEKQDSYN